MSKRFNFTKEDKIVAKAFDKKGNNIAGLSKSNFQSINQIINEIINIIGEENIKKIQYINIVNEDRNLQDDFLINGKRKPY